MNLVVGATGLLGSEICRRLAAAGKPVRALVRATSDPAPCQHGPIGPFPPAGNRLY
jgi:uncharacterized protein YbjT (DUF2867 family)